MKYKNISLVPKKADIVIVAFVAIAALSIIFAFTGADNGSIAVILQDGKEITRIDLKAAGTREVEVNGLYHNKILCRDGRIGVVESDCPGEVCVQSGFISGGGKSIVCLPNRMEIRIVGESDVDIVVG